MRSCMYCGKDLKPNEICECAGAQARRAGKQDTGSDGANKNPYRTETSYKTGYAGKDSKFERARTRYKAKKAAKRNSPRELTDGLWSYVKTFLKSPVDTIANPPHLSKLSMLIIAVVLGAFLWLCAFFILRGESVRLMRIIAGAMGLNGGDGLRMAVTVPVVMLMGAFGGIVLFFAYAGVFWLINRFVMRLKTPFWEFSVRLVSAWIPFAVICIFGAVISILSPVTIAVLLVCGGIITSALTYEGLKTEWVAYPAGKVLYAMLLGYFVLFAFVSHLIFI